MTPSQRTSPLELDPPRRRGSPVGRREGRTARLLVSALVGALLAATPALGWTDASRTQLVRKAIRLMPESLREMMELHERQLLAGLLQPGSPEDQPEHWQHPEGAYGTAARRAEAEAQALVQAVDGHAPFAGIVRRFGALAHWVSDVNDPLRAGDPDDRLSVYYPDYQRYLQERMPRFPLVFHGYRAATLTASGPASYLMESAERSRAYARAVRRAYDEEGQRISAAAFDVRSLAFGVGSLSYSHAVNDIARVWLWAWEQAHGDTTRMPFPLDPPAVADEEDPPEQALIQDPTP